MIEVEIDKSVYLDCYHHLVDDDPTIDIDILWGGRDSGKSQYVAQKLTDESLDAAYFRCLLIKETHESIKDSQWQMIQDVATDWGIDGLFTFTASPLSIRNTNGAVFAARGMNKPGRVRSFTNPSHCWIEEGNQITEAGFITLITSLRSNKGRVKLYITLNPESTAADYEEFWMYKWFFADYAPAKSFIGVKVLSVKVGKEVKEVRLKYRVTHTTYNDNPFVSDQRKAFHESLQETNPYWYNVFTLGEWGNAENDSPWAFAFSRKKHVGACTLNKSHPLILSWDFNRNPICCTVAQHYDNHLRVLETIKIPKSGVDAMCQYIKVHYPGCLYMVTGDYNGQNASSLFQEYVSHYKMIKHYLNLSDGQIKIKPNPRLHKNQQHVNTILAFYKVTIDSIKGRPLIFDMEKVKKRADGTIVKDDRDDPTQQSDALDTFRYICNIFLEKYKPVL